MAEQQANNIASGIEDLFGEVSTVDGSVLGDPVNVYQRFLSAREWTGKERLTGEKETLGLYVTGHPIDDYETELRRFIPTPIASARADGKSNQKLVGLIVASRTMKTKRGDTMAIITLDDRSARIELTVYAEAFQQSRELLVKDQLVVVDGSVGHDDYSGGLSMRVSQLWSLDQARGTFASCLSIRLNGGSSVSSVGKLKSLLTQATRGECAVVIDYDRGDAAARIAIGADYAVQPTDDLLAALADLDGTLSVNLCY